MEPFNYRNDRLVAVHIAATILECSPRTVRRYIQRGRLRARRVNRRAWGIVWSDVVCLQGKLGALYV
jgi:predicted site-specific integrase-resolvase